MRDDSEDLEPLQVEPQVPPRASTGAGSQTKRVYGPIAAGVAVVAGLGLLVAFLLWQATNDDGERVGVTPTSKARTPASTTSDTPNTFFDYPLPPLNALKGSRPFVPPTRREGGNTVIPVTFLDGTSIELVHPPTVDLAQLGLAGEAGVVLPGSVPTGAALAILQGSPEEIFSNRTPDRRWANGAKEYDKSAGAYLAVPIGSWTVIATTESTSNDERATFAMAIAGHVNSNGYLVLTPHPPVMLVPADGPDIQFGSGVVGLIRRPCDPLSGRHTSAGLAIESGTDNQLAGTSLCDQRRNLVIHLSGQAEQIADQLQVRPKTTGR